MIRLEKEKGLGWYGGRGGREKGGGGLCVSGKSEAFYCGILIHLFRTTT